MRGSPPYLEIISREVFPLSDGFPQLSVNVRMVTQIHGLATGLSRTTVRCGTIHELNLSTCMKETLG